MSGPRYIPTNAPNLTSSINSLNSANDKLLGSLKNFRNIKTDYDARQKKDYNDIVSTELAAAKNLEDFQKISSFIDPDKISDANKSFITNKIKGIESNNLLINLSAKDNIDLNDFKDKNLTPKELNRYMALDKTKETKLKDKNKLTEIARLNELGSLTPKELEYYTPELLNIKKREQDSLEKEQIYLAGLGLENEDITDLKKPVDENGSLDLSNILNPNVSEESLNIPTKNLTVASASNPKGSPVYLNNEGLSQLQNTPEYVGDLNQLNNTSPIENNNPDVFSSVVEDYSNRINNVRSSKGDSRDKIAAEKETITEFKREYGNKANEYLANNVDNKEEAFKFLNSNITDDIAKVFKTTKTDLVNQYMQGYASRSDSVSNRINQNNKNLPENTKNRVKDITLDNDRILTEVNSDPNIGYINGFNTFESEIKAKGSATTPAGVIKHVKSKFPDADEEVLTEQITKLKKDNPKLTLTDLGYLLEVGLTEFKDTSWFNDNGNWKELINNHIRRTKGDTTLTDRIIKAVKELNKLNKNWDNVDQSNTKNVGKIENKANGLRQLLDTNYKQLELQKQKNIPINSTKEQNELSKLQNIIRKLKLN